MLIHIYTYIHTQFSWPFKISCKSFYCQYNTCFYLWRFHTPFFVFFYYFLFLLLKKKLQQQKCAPEEFISSSKNIYKYNKTQFFFLSSSTGSYCCCYFYFVGAAWYIKACHLKCHHFNFRNRIIFYCFVVNIINV